jgi:alanyl-tRNA synthetase
MLQAIKEAFLRYYRDRYFTMYPSFPLVTKDPSVLFTNAAITPFKTLFDDSKIIVPQNYAIIQKCLRVRGITEDLETVRGNPNYISLFDMFGSCDFSSEYQRNVDNFLDLLTYMGLAREKLLFTVPPNTKFTGALLRSGISESRVFTIEKNGRYWQQWFFGKNGLIGKGITAIYNHDGNGATSFDEIVNYRESFVGIGNLIHVYGKDQDGETLSIAHEGFEVGIGVERLVTALHQCSPYDLVPFRDLVNLVVRSLKNLGCINVAPEVPRILTDHLRVINALVSEGVTPGNKQHQFVLRKMIRSFLEVLWLSVGSIISTEELVKDFGELDVPDSVGLIVEIVSGEEKIFRDTLDRGKKVLADNPSLNQEVLRGTYGIRQSLIPLIRR